MRERMTFSNVVSVLALFVALGGGALAASSIVGRDGKVHACYAKSSGAVRLVGQTKACNRSERKASWNQKGQKGARGQQGAPGTPGTKGADGTNGSAGAPGSIIVAKLRGTLASLAAGQNDIPITLTPSGWSQAAGELHFVTGNARLGTATGCNTGTGMVVNISAGVDTLLAPITSLGNTETKPLQLAGGGESSLVSLVAPLFETAAARDHTMTIKASNGCAGTVTNLEVAVDVVAVR
jgi:hypothetical protein